ncbi:hypothetical protein ScPMuIL_018195 [Solemya velum]
MDKNSTLPNSALLKKINILDTIYWVANSWKEVERSTISKYFEKCGFPSESETVEDVDIDDTVPLSLVKLANKLFGCELSDLANLDRELSSCDNVTEKDWNASAVDLLKMNATEESEVSDINDDGIQLESENKTVPTLDEMDEMIEKMKLFALHKDKDDMKVVKNGRSEEKTGDSKCCCAESGFEEDIVRKFDTKRMLNSQCK